MNSDRPYTTPLSGHFFVLFFKNIIFDNFFESILIFFLNFKIKEKSTRKAPTGPQNMELFFELCELRDITNQN